MSVSTLADDDVATIVTTEATSDARYTFKVTIENKTEYVAVSLKKDDRQTVRDLVVNNARWRSDSQFLVDAIVFYLNDDSVSTSSAEEVAEKMDWNSETQLAASITPTLAEEIELMVDHTHTPWNTKQEFLICSIEAYNTAGFPVVNQR